MPALKGIDEKYFNGYKIDKENDDAIYSDEAHVYIDKHTNQKYISVTTLIGLYENAYDKDFWSSYKALEALMPFEIWQSLKKKLLDSEKFLPKYLSDYNIDVDEFNRKKQEILDGYAENNKVACERGTNIHAMFENATYGKNTFDFKNLGYDELCGEFVCEKNYYKLDLERGVYPEFLISRTSRDGILKVAGQIDLLIKDGNDIWIADYKTNKKIDKRSYKDKRMKFPLNNLPDSNFWHYSLQLSLYAYLLQQINPEFNIRGLKLIHIDHDNKQHEYECEYLKDDVERMLKHYKKKIKIESELDCITPIKY